MMLSLQSIIIVAICVSRGFAFGPATPVGGQASITNAGCHQNQLAMRVSISDLKRRQKITTILDRGVVPNNPVATKEVIETTIMTESTAALLKACNWKVRDRMTRKIRNLACKYDVAVDPSFGMPTPRLQREAELAEQATVKKAKRKKHFDMVKAEQDARVAARRAAEAGTEADIKKQAAIRQTKRDEAAEKEAEQSRIETTEARMQEEAKSFDSDEFDKEVEATDKAASEKAKAAEDEEREE